MPNIIRPTDFAQFENSTRTLGKWDPATLRRLVPLVVGQPVIVGISDTGHAVVGEIVAIHESTRNSQYPHLEIRDAHDSTLYAVSRIAEIIVLGESTAKWDLLSSLSDQTRAALSAVRQFIGADFPAGAPYKGARRFTTTVTWDAVRVAWGESFRDRRWHVTADGTVTPYA